MFTLNNLFFLLTGLLAAYLVWRFYTRWSKGKKLYDVYYPAAVLDGPGIYPGIYAGF